jgi:hypothetical protein
MKHTLALGLLILAACNPMNVTPDEKRWASLKGDEVYVVQGHSTMVHGNPACPELRNPKGDVLKCKISGNRVVDANGVYLNSEREKPPLCPHCVR